MSNLAVSDDETRQLVQPESSNSSTQEYRALQVGEVEKPHSHTEMPIEKPRVSEMSARDVLASLSKMRIYATEIVCAINGFQVGGTYANVSAASLTRAGQEGGEERKVAVKKFRFAINSDLTEEKLLRIFVNELRVLNRLSHRHIFKILGFVEDVENRIAWLVFPWEENGNLREFLRSEKWEIPERVSLIQGVASGLEYLHTQQPRICHGDLKSLNVLINSSNRVVIIDFGSARIIQHTEELRTNASVPAASAAHGSPSAKDLPQLHMTTSKTALTLTGPAYSLRWAPPEVLNGEPPNLASDIWALGWIAWEALTGSYPFEELTSEFDITMMIIEGRLPSIYDHDQLSQIHRLCSLMQRCWNPEPTERPSATDCKRSLGWIPHAIPASRGSTNTETERRSATLMLKMGEMHRLQSRDAEASKMYEQGLAIARSNEDQITVADILLRMAESARTQGKYVDAEAHYNQALAICETIGSDLGRANALDGLGHIQRTQYKYVEAEASHTQALSIHTRVRNELGQANALRGLGQVQLARSKYLEAEASYSRALAIYTTIGSDLGRANSLKGLGDVQQTQSKYVEAGTSYRQALPIFESLGISVGQANALNGLADAQLALGEFAEAEASLIKVMEICTSIQHDLSWVTSSLRLGQIWLRQGRWAEVKVLTTEAATMSERIGYVVGKAASKGLLDELLEAERSPTQSKSTTSG